MNHKETLNKNKIFIINIISLLMGFTGGLLIYITSAYFKDILHSTNIGWTFLIANIILLIALLNIHKIALVVGRETLFHFLLIIKISIFIALLFTIGNFASIALLVFYIVFEALSWTVLKMILESYSTDKKTGQIYGLNLTLINTGLILSPIIATQLLDKSGFVGIFYLSIFLNLFIFVISFFNLRQRNKQPITQPQYKKLFTTLKQRPDIQKIFLVSFSLEFFFAIMVIYTPLYLLENGFTWVQIGTLFTVMLVPLIIIPYPIGLLADKKLGEKELLILSFIAILFSSLFLYFSNDAFLTSLMVMLFISRIGAAFVSILRLSYFYKRIDKDDVNMISFFHTARPLAFIIAPAISGILLIFFPLSSVFLLIVFVSFLTLLPIYKLTDNISELQIK